MLYKVDLSPDLVPFHKVVPVGEQKISGGRRRIGRVREERE